MREVDSIQDLSNAFGHSLAKFVLGAQAIPLLRKFSVADRASLVKTHAPRRFILNALQQSQNLNGYLDLGSNFLRTINQTKPDRESATSIFFDSLVFLVNGVKKLQITNEEYAYLKANSLFDPCKLLSIVKVIYRRINISQINCILNDNMFFFLADAPGLENKTLVQDIGSYFYQKFECYKFALPSSEANRLGKLLLISREITTLARKFFVLLQQSNVTMDSLQTEIFSKQR